MKLRFITIRSMTLGEHKSTEIPALEMVPGLAVHPDVFSPLFWRITHIPAGLALGDCMSPFRALLGAEKLGVLGNWDVQMPGEDLKNAAKKAMNEEEQGELP